MPRFLFWNLNGRPIHRLVRDVAHTRNIDVLILAECNVALVELIGALNSERAEYRLVPSSCARLWMFTRFDPGYFQAKDEGEHFSIGTLTLPARSSLVVAAAHLASGLFFSPQSRIHECERLARKITAVENKVGHRRTIFLGDMNVNPFEQGLVATEGFHAVMSRDVALRGARVVQGQDYPFFTIPCGVTSVIGPTDHPVLITTNGLSTSSTFGTYSIKFSCAPSWHAALRPKMSRS